MESTTADLSYQYWERVCACLLDINQLWETRVKTETTTIFMTTNTIICFHSPWTFFIIFLVCPEVYECIQPYRTSQHTSFWYADHSYRCDSITKLYSCLERNIPKRCFTKDLYVSLLREKYQLREILTNICKRRRE